MTSLKFANYFFNDGTISPGRLGMFDNGEFVKMKAGCWVIGFFIWSDISDKIDQSPDNPTPQSLPVVQRGLLTLVQVMEELLPLA